MPSSYFHSGLDMLRVRCRHFRPFSAVSGPFAVIASGDDVAVDIGPAFASFKEMLRGAAVSQRFPLEPVYRYSLWAFTPLWGHVRTGNCVKLMVMYNASLPRRNVAITK